MSRRMRVVALTVALTTMLMGCSGSPDQEAPSAGSGPDQSATGEGPLLLAFGDSLTSGADKQQAWPALVAKKLAAEGHPVRLVNVACGGEDTTTVIEGGPCHPGADGQLTQAESLLRANAGKVGAVTVWIGVNDYACLVKGQLDQACLAAADRTTAEKLPTILGRIREAAGPKTLIFALEYYDPFRAAGDSAEESALKQASGPAVHRLNDRITKAASAVGAHLIETGPAIEGSDGKKLCETTFVCSRGDIHLKAEGQLILRDLVLKGLADQGGVGGR